MGALEYNPSPRIKGLNKSAKIALDSLISITQHVLDSRGGINEDIAADKDDALLNLIQVGTSAGGARPKAVIGLNQDRTTIRSGQADLPSGFEHFLIKFDGVKDQSKGQETFGAPMGFGRMEFAYYKMAIDCGINMNPCELLEDGPRTHFLTKRFDRPGNNKIHMQSLCAMDHADFKNLVCTVMRSYFL
jgi:serine/threonine-protein kinase HipA